MTLGGMESILILPIYVIVYLSCTTYFMILGLFLSRLAMRTYTRSRCHG